MALTSRNIQHGRLGPMQAGCDASMPQTVGLVQQRIPDHGGGLGAA
jgi:hypothetical protein